MKMNILRPIVMSQSITNRSISIQVTSSQVTHDPERRKFLLNLNSDKQPQKVAWIDYKIIDNKTIDLHHSEVPKELRGQGIGLELARGALERAVESELKVKLTCSYLIRFLDKYADEELKKRALRN